MRSRLRGLAIALLCVVPFLPTQIARAESSVTPSLESILIEMRTSQGLSDDEMLNCDEATNEQLEELGEALMGIAYPNPDEHALMDRMMGGDGSPSLALTHRMMGARYLGCYSGDVRGPAIPGMGMMGGMTGYGGGWQGGPMMGWGMNSAMGHGHWGFMPWGWGSLVVWAAIIAAVVLIIYFVSRGPRESSSEGRKDALEILRHRYASGEITKEQFEEMRDTLMKRG
jgi:putative membrane protein